MAIASERTSLASAKEYGVIMKMSGKLYKKLHHFAYQKLPTGEPPWVSEDTRLMLPKSGVLSQALQSTDPPLGSAKISNPL